MPFDIDNYAVIVKRKPNKRNKTRQKVKRTIRRFYLYISSYLIYFLAVEFVVLIPIGIVSTLEHYTLFGIDSFFIIMISLFCLFPLILIFLLYLPLLVNKKLRKKLDRVKKIAKIKQNIICAKTAEKEIKKQPEPVETQKKQNTEEHIKGYSCWDDIGGCCGCLVLIILAIMVINWILSFFFPGCPLWAKFIIVLLILSFI